MLTANRGRSQDLTPGTLTVGRGLRLDLGDEPGNQLAPRNRCQPRGEE